MKIFKELIPFLYQKAILNSVPTKSLKSRNIKNEIPVIVSLTTVPSRINIVHLTIRSILVQKAKPKKIHLWVHKDLKTIIPPQLKKLEGEVFEICYSQIDCPHLKLIEELKQNVNIPIVTIDDDHVYSRRLLKELYNTHLNHPKYIISTISRLIKFDGNNTPLPYQEWPYINKASYENRFLLPLGVYGVLYPPNSFNREVINIDLIESLAPKADDLWFKALSIINGTHVRIIDKEIRKPTMLLGTQEITLKKYNISQNNNVIQWKNLIDFFKIEINP